MKDRKIVLGLLLLVIITSSFFMNTINAGSGYIEIDDYYSDYSAQFLQSEYIQVSNNRFLYVYPVGTHDFQIDLYSDDDGLLLQEYKLEIEDKGSGAVWIFNQTHAIILISIQDELKTYLYEYSSNTVHASSNTIDPSDIHSHFSYWSNVITEYNNCTYFYGTTRGGYLLVIKYDWSTNQLSEEIGQSINSNPDTDYLNIPLVIHNNNESEQVLLGVGDSGDRFPKYYLFDMSDDSLSSLCTHPFSTDRIGDYDQESVAFFKNYDKFLGGDIIYNGTQIWVYFTWLHPLIQDEVSHRVIQHRIVFNETISSGALLGQNERTATINPTIDATGRTWIDGYMINKTHIRVFYPAELGGIDYLYTDLLELDDWWNYAGGTIDRISHLESSDYTKVTYPENFPDDEKDMVSRDWGGSWIVRKDYSDDFDDGWLYYGLEPVTVEYDLVMSYSPNDEPLIVDKSYSWMITLYANDVGIKKTIAIYMDDIQAFVVQTGSNGQYTYTFLSGITGVREWNIKVLSNVGNIVYEEDFYYTWVRGDISDEPTSDILIPRTTSYLVAMLPTFIMIIMPTFAFGLVGSEVSGTIGGSIGFLLGGILGVGISVMSGFLPSWMTYLLILAVVSACVLIIKGGFGGSTYE
jgi:hypothetical protein